MRRAALVTFAFMLAACGRPPHLEPPDLDFQAPRQWSSSSDSLQLEQPPLDWWREFGDPQLDSLIAIALVQNFSLKMVAANIETARGLAKAAGADLWPQVNGSGRAGRTQQVFTGLPIPGRDGPLKSLSTTYGASLDMSWELDLWGRLRAGRSAAGADLQAARADYAGAALSLAGQTAKAYFAAVEADRQVELAKATVESFERLAQSIRERYVRGVRPSIDLRFALTNLAGAKARLAGRRLLRDNAGRQLEVLLARYPSNSLILPESLPIVLSPPPDGIPSELVQRRPDLVASERRLAAADKRAGGARRQLYPRISLTASAGRSSDALEDLLDGDFSVWSLVGNIVQPLFQGGRIRGGIIAAEGREAQVWAAFAQNVLNAYAEVEGALDAEEILREQEAALTETVTQAKASLSLSEERYRQGLVDVTTVLEARRNYFEAQSQLLETQRRRLDGRVNLHLALGGGFQANYAGKSDATSRGLTVSEVSE